MAILKNNNNKSRGKDNVLKNRVDDQNPKPVL